VIRSNVWRGALRPLALLILFTGVLLGGPAQAKPAESDAKVAFAEPVTFAGRGRPMLRVVLDITARRPADVRLRLFVKPVEGRPLAAGRAVERVVKVARTARETVLVPAAAGDVELTAIVEPAAGGVSDAEVRYVRIGQNGKVTTFEAAPYLALHGREVAARRPGYGHQTPQLPAIGSRPRIAGTGEAGAPAVLPRPGGVHLGSGTISTSAGAAVPGRRGGTSDKVGGTSQPLLLQGIMTTMVNGVTVPMRNTVVEVWDSDSLSPDDLLGTVRTLDDGSYAINVTNDDGPLGGGVDVYLYVSTHEPKVGVLYLVPDGEGGYYPFYYGWRSPTVDNITAPVQTISFRIDDQASAASVWSGASRAEWLAEQKSGHSPAYVEIRYPGFVPGTFFMNNMINIDPENNAPEVVGHEYGHALMYLAYGSIPGEGGIHYACQAASPGLAWSEGFATYVGLLSGGDSGVMHWTAGDGGASIENWSCALDAMSSDEFRVAAGLWDLWDSANDDNGGTTDRGRNGLSDSNQGTQLVSIDQTVQTLWIRNQSNVGDYWSDLQTRLQAPQTAPSTTIMNYNWYP